MRLDFKSGQWAGQLAAVVLTTLVLGGVVLAGSSATGPELEGLNKVSRAGDTMTGTLTSTVASGSNAFVINTGARYCFDSTCQHRLVQDATNQISFVLANAQLLTVNAGTGTVTNVSSGPGFVSAAASGSNGFACTTNGCRIDFGAGANDYASSDGTTVTFAGPATFSGTVTNTGPGAATGFDYTGIGIGFRTATASGTDGVNFTTDGARLHLGSNAATWFDASGASLRSNAALMPVTADTQDLGTSASRWRNAFFNTFQPVGITTPSGNSLFLVAANTLAISANGTEVLRFPTTLGASGTVLTSGGAGATATWGAAPVTSAGATFGGDVNNTAYPINTAWAAFTPFVAGTTQKLTWVTETAGVGAGTILGTLFDVTGAANVCTVTITCNSAAGVVVGPSTCGPAALAASRTYDMRWTTDGCATRPAGELTLTYTTP